MRLKKKLTKKLQRTAAIMGVVVLTVSLAAGASAHAAKKKEKKQELDPNGTYHASLGVQTSTDLWITRMAYFEESQNEYYGTEHAGEMFCQSKEKPGEHEMKPGTFNDAEITGNGTYTVSLEGGDFSGEKDISQLHIATDIPLNDTIQFSNVSLNINGRKVIEFEEGFLEDQEPYLQGGMVCLLLNHWRPELVQALQDKGLSEDASSGYSLLQGTGEENITVTFTVSGFAYDNPEAQGESQEQGDGTADDGAVSSDNLQSDRDAGSGNGVALYIPILIAVVVVIVIVIAITRKGKKKS